MRRAHLHHILLLALAVAVSVRTDAATAAAEPLRLAAAFTARNGTEILPVFGPSGVLKDRIAAGEPADLFASANMEHPRALAASGHGRPPVVLFARNRLCALVRPGLGIDSPSLLDRMLDPSIHLATSTPKADPAGDYAWALFRKAEALRPGARASLEAKALRLAGSADAPPPPPGRTVYGLVMERGEADIFLTYCTNAMQAAQEVQRLEVVALPDALSVGADYGLVVLTDRPEAASLALFVLSPSGQAILARHGFAAPTLPGEG